MIKKSITIAITAIVLSAATGLKAQQLSEKDIPTSKALPQGMKLMWHDEFNQQQLDTTKWWDRYFSSLDWFNNKAAASMQNNTLPAADYEMTGNSIILKATDKLYPGANRQISSIQSYNYTTNQDKTEGLVGGFIEARIRRDIEDGGDRVNLAFWFDSPGPDLKYYLEKDGEALGIKGIRPRGQVFEIDMCEYITTEIVLHGNVDKNGKFERNIGHHIVKGDFKGKWVTHSMLWSPSGLKFYIDGELVKEYWDVNDIKSPNHAMNIFFGAYGINGVTMEVDYVRFYQWDTTDNLLPNGDFSYSGTIFPWEGKGKIVNSEKGNKSLQLKQGESVTQMIYLDHSAAYELTVNTKGRGNIAISAANIEQVTGKEVNRSEIKAKTNKRNEMLKLKFNTLPEPENNKRSVKIEMRNNGIKEIIIYKTEVVKQY